MTPRHPPSCMPLCPDMIIGGCYELVNRLGRGGMAEVWVARKRDGAKRSKYVALKITLDAMAGDDRYRRMFRKEAELAQLMNHGNIVQVFDEGEDDGRSYMVMEWVDGCSVVRLRDAFATESDLHLRFRLAAYVAGQLLHGLAYAHALTSDTEDPLGIVHRDVTPHNVLVSNQGDVKLSDFGVAHVSYEESSGSHVCGKIRYMSWEHLAGKSHARSVDLFAAGAVLYEMLGGVKFRGETTDGRMLYGEVLSGVVPPLPLALPPALAAVLYGLLEPDLSKRIPTADVALQMLAHWPGYGEMKQQLGHYVANLTGTRTVRSGYIERRPHYSAIRSAPLSGASEPQREPDPPGAPAGPRQEFTAPQEHAPPREVAPPRDLRTATDPATPRPKAPRLPEPDRDDGFAPPSAPAERPRGIGFVPSLLDAPSTASELSKESASAGSSIVELLDRLRPRPVPITRSIAVKPEELAVAAVEHTELLAPPPGAATGVSPTHLLHQDLPPHHDGLADVPQRVPHAVTMPAPAAPNAGPLSSPWASPPLAPIATTPLSVAPAAPRPPSPHAPRLAVRVPSAETWTGSDGTRVTIDDRSSTWLRWVHGAAIVVAVSALAGVAWAVRPEAHQPPPSLPSVTQASVRAPTAEARGLVIPEVSTVVEPSGPVVDSPPPPSVTPDPPPLENSANPEMEVPAGGATAEPQPSDVAPEQPPTVAPAATGAAPGRGSAKRRSSLPPVPKGEAILHVRLRGVSGVELRLGSRRYSVDPYVDEKIPLGHYRASWREKDGPWRRAGTLTLDDPNGNYAIFLSPMGLSLVKL